MNLNHELSILEYSNICPRQNQQMGHVKNRNLRGVHQPNYSHYSKSWCLLYSSVLRLGAAFSPDRHLCLAPRCCPETHVILAGLVFLELHSFPSGPAGRWGQEAHLGQYSLIGQVYLSSPCHLRESGRVSQTGFAISGQPYKHSKQLTPVQSRP